MLGSHRGKGKGERGKIALGWAGACAWASLGCVGEREMVLAGSGCGPKRGLGGKEFEFEFEGPIQIQIPHIGTHKMNIKQENPTTNSKQGRLRLNLKGLQEITLTSNGP
jgi:hypothetical protein